jgi:hypothetical protein
MALTERCSSCEKIVPAPIFFCHNATEPGVISGGTIVSRGARDLSMQAKPDPQRHQWLHENRPYGRGLIVTTLWSVIKRTRSSEEKIAAAARRELGAYYYDSIRRVFRTLLREPIGRGDDAAMELTHRFLDEKVWSEDCPLLRNVAKLDKMKAEEDAGTARRAFRAYLQRALRNFLISSRDSRHASLDAAGPGEDGRAANLPENLPADQDLDELVRTAWAEELLNQAVQRLEERDRRLVAVKLSGESWEAYARREGKSADAVRNCWVRRVIPMLRIRIDDLLDEEHAETLDRDAELRECLRLADRKGQLLELLTRAAPGARSGHV